MVSMRRRRSRVRDPEWERVAASTVARFTHLDPESAVRVVEQARELDRTRGWEGLDGLRVTQAMRAEISASACVLTVQIGLGALRDVSSILISATSTVRTTRHRVAESLVTERDACVLGETLLHGPLRLAWDRVLADTVAGSPTSVVIHEFAHKVDMGDGIADGSPPIGDRSVAVAFERAADEVLQRLRDGDEVAGLRGYAATNRTELFAVATESFVLTPRELVGGAPDLYRGLAAFYRQDPAGIMPVP